MNTVCTAYYSRRSYGGIYTYTLESFGFGPTCSRYFLFPSMQTSQSPSRFTAPTLPNTLQDLAKSTFKAQLRSDSSVGMLG